MDQIIIDSSPNSVQNGKMQYTLPQATFEQNDESQVNFLNKAVAPMPGVLDKLLVAPGDNVKKGDPLFVLIAMKMEHVVKAPRDAKIQEVCHKTGENVAKDATVVQFVEI